MPTRKNRQVDMKLTYLFLLISCICFAEDFESQFTAHEKDFQKIQKIKAQREARKTVGLDAFLTKKERDAAQKRIDLEAYLQKKRGERGPADSAEDEDNRQKEALRVKNQEGRHQYVETQYRKEAARQKVQTAFDSKELRLRETKPWR